MKRWLAILLVAVTAGTALAAGRPSLNAYFQSTLTDTAYQKKTFDTPRRSILFPPDTSTPR